jgi:hypothetical protein
MSFMSNYSTTLIGRRRLEVPVAREEGDETPLSFRSASLVGGDFRFVKHKKSQ